MYSELESYEEDMISKEMHSITKMKAEFVNVVIKVSSLVGERCVAALLSRSACDQHQCHYREPYP